LARTPPSGHDEDVLLAALVLGALAAYYFGLRAGAWVAVATLVICLTALFVPSLARSVQVIIAVAAVAIWRIGSRRPRPPDAVLAVRYVRYQLKRAATWLRRSR
jgi:hypothetical protein